MCVFALSSLNLSVTDPRTNGQILLKSCVSPTKNIHIIYTNDFKRMMLYFKNILD